jgi:hypothetical protein
VTLRRSLVIAITCSLAFVAAAGSSRQAYGAVYNVAADFEAGWLAHANPNGVWTYGYSSGFVGPLSLYDQTVQNGVNGPNAQYWLSSAVNIGTSPSAEFNNGPAFNDGNVVFSANEFLLVAGIGGQYSDVIFTAPTSGRYSITSSFVGSQNGIGTVVGVLVDGGIVFNSSVASVGQIVPFDANVNLVAGETVEFSVGPGGGLQNTGLSAAIKSGPASVAEPGTLTLLSVGLLGLGLLRRRRQT